jgi:hypothetical protein
MNQLQKGHFQAATSGSCANALLSVAKACIDSPVDAWARIQEPAYASALGPPLPKSPSIRLVRLLSPEMVSLGRSSRVIRHAGGIVGRKPIEPLSDGAEHWSRIVEGAASNALRAE